MDIPLFQVDAFTSRVFGGNPAAVCPLEQWLPDETLQSIAAENNLAETAYFLQKGSRFELRWFTPLVEVDLCGHATLASAYVLFHHLGFAGEVIHFDTKSGELRVSRDGDLLTLDFPSRPITAIEPESDLLDALGGNPVEVLAAQSVVVVYATETEILALNPDMAGLMKSKYFGIIVTAPGNECDFVSRFFAPAKGIPEDPVTGSAHTHLIPYWATRLGKSEMTARQLSKRGGELYCKLEGDRAKIAGHAAPFLHGIISIPSDRSANQK